jgi:hypothetical protein
VLNGEPDNDDIDSVIDAFNIGNLSVHEARVPEGDIFDQENDLTTARLLKTLEYQKLELVSTLQEINDAAIKIHDKFKHSDPKRLNKNLGKLRVIIDNSRLEIAQQFMMPDQFARIEDFDKFLKEKALNSEMVRESWERLELSILASLDGKLEENPLKIMLEDPLTSRETYEKILNKFYSMVRYEMYNAIKAYIKERGSPEDGLNDDEIYDVAQKINFPEIQQKVFELYEQVIECNDVNLTMKKLDFVFQH